MRLSTALALALLATAPIVRAASLDVTAAYKMKAVSYSNLNYNTRDKNNHSFITNDARLGIAVRKIPLETRGGEDVTMDLGIVLHAIGASGSTVAVSAPFDRIAAYYPSSDLTPFIENAYVRVHRLWGLPWETTFGRQNYKLGGGLLLDDDGAGFTGASARAELPWWNMKLEGFIFNDRNPLSSPANSLDLAGASLDVPGEGVWQLNQLFERDRSQQTVYGCDFAGNLQQNGCLISKAVRSFTSARYQISYGPMVFDGEAAIEKGYATPTAGRDPATGALQAPAGNHITYNGNAQVVRMKWKQALWKTGEGIARVSFARGSGDNPGTGTTDEAFFPSRGHRHAGLERVGFGELFAATPYDGFGGNYSTTTKSGLRNGASGLMVIGAGYTPPAYKSITIDVDFFLYQAERISNGSRTLGTEWDVRVRYPIRDQLALAAGVAYFRAGKFTDPGRSVARKYSFEVSGRF
jgi:hypothetical protein